MKDAANKAIDKMERGETPTVADLRAAGFCLMCAGFGYICVGKDLDEQKTCTRCGGDGLLRSRKV